MEKISKSQIKLVKSLQQKKFRDELGLFVAEGEKCVEELRKSFELEYLIVEDGLTAMRSYSANGLIAKRSELEQMSCLRTPQGVIGVFKKNSYSEAVLQSKGRSYSASGLTGEAGQHLTLALDAIQDPGNLGTIIRTCDWFGVHDIFCSRDTADCYNPKVVQATMGALARVRVHYVDLPEWLKSQITNCKSQIAIIGTLLEGRDMYEELSTLDTRLILLLWEMRVTVSRKPCANSSPFLSVSPLIQKTLRLRKASTFLLLQRSC
jgi:TrmH family RNA methyltransferase